MPQIATAFAAGGKDVLGSEMTASLATLRGLAGVQSITFFKAPATAFYRVHEPAKFGDDAGTRRQMVLRATKDGTPSAGIEPGREGLFMFGTAPVKHEGALVGAIDVGLPFGTKFANELKARIGVDVAIHFYNGIEFKTVATTLPEKTIFASDDYGAALGGELVLRQLTRSNVASLAYLGPIRDFSGKPVGVVEVVDSMEELMRISDRSRQGLAIATTGVLAVAILIGVLITTGLTRPLHAMTLSMRRLAEGDLEARIAGLRRKDELGAMAAALQVFKDNAAEARRPASRR
jgi:methyl-accepting chemotaxis protein